MKCVITGAAGFVGSYVLRQALGAGDECAVLLRAQSDTRRIDDVLGGATVIEGDLFHPETYRAALYEFAPDAVIHLAWAGVINSARNDAGQELNVDATLELVRSGREAGASSFIGLGSQAEYGPCSDVIGEDEPTTPTTMYGKAKLRACEQAGALCDELGMRFAWLRLFSSYGPGDHPEWMIPYLINKLLADEKPAMTAGEQLWDYIHVRDAARAVHAVASTREARGEFNLGTGSARPIREIVELIRDFIDPALPLGFGEVPYRPDQVMHLQANVARLREATGWSPQTDLETGLLETVEWHREQRNDS